MNNNLKIWDQVSTTETSATSTYKGPGGFQGTAINTMSMIHKATEVFGPIGIGWGYEIIEERFDEGAPITKKVEELGHDVEIAKAVTHTLRIKLWAMIDGQRAEIENYGHTPFVYGNKYGIQTDGEASKKSLTDAIKKCLSMFGFSADVFMGMHDDPEYINAMREQEELNKSDDMMQTAIDQRQEYNDWKDTTMRVVSDSVSLHELEKLFVAAIRKATRLNDKKYIKEITIAKDKRKEELSNEAA